ncbi:hypothetical protein RF11_07949 [Thelohanellus kitauei]|uniref:Uncharacterized protein n=1 Tax=Thelohanellus kitauei TaxID=669202 RepID=A0A0C2JGL9_THEKT|nr:hypothetical protein RF11_07949 [Thelohanellus kitauei]
MSNDCDVIGVGGLLLHTRERADQHFRINKFGNITKVRLSVTCYISFKTSKDFHITLKIVPVLEADSDYKLKSIMSQDVEFIVFYSFKYCIKEFSIIVISALALNAVILACCYLIFYVGTHF